MAFGGEGVARCGNYVIFIPDVIPGERARARITASKRSYGRAVPTAILEASPDRVMPRCAVYGICGGCQYQHMRYERSLELKERQVAEVIQRIAGLGTAGMIAAIRPAPGPWHYRNVITLKVKRREGGWDGGYVARDNTTFVPVSCCPIAADGINEALVRISESLDEFELPEKIAEVTIKHAGGQTLIYPRYVRPYRFRPDDRLEYRHQDLKFRYGLRSFFQVNHSMIPLLLELVDEALGPEPGQGLLDLYAGVGLFSIAQAGKFDRVVAVEVAGEAVECMYENIKENRVRNISVVRGTVEKTIGRAYRKVKSRPVSVIADPPREGMRPEVIRFLKGAGIRKIVYVSCDPSTLARDLKALATTFSVESITPLDMFPQTGHLESVAALRRLDG